MSWFHPNFHPSVPWPDERRLTSGAKATGSWKSWKAQLTAGHVQCTKGTARRRTVRRRVGRQGPSAERSRGWRAAARCVLVGP